MRIPGTTESLWIDDERRIKNTDESVAHHLIMVERVAQEDRRQQETEVNRIIQADFNLLFTQGNLVSVKTLKRYNIL